MAGYTDALAGVRRVRDSPQPAAWAGKLAGEGRQIGWHKSPPGMGPEQVREVAPAVLGLAGVALDETDPLRYNSQAVRAGGRPRPFGWNGLCCAYGRDRDWEEVVWL
jgi:hypothetical protein